MNRLALMLAGCLLLPALSFTGAHAQGLPPDGAFALLGITSVSTADPGFRGTFRNTVFCPGLSNWSTGNLQISGPAGVVQNNKFDVKSSCNPMIFREINKLLSFPGDYTVVGIDTGVTVTLAFFPGVGYIPLPQGWTMTTDTVTVRVVI